MFAYGSASIWTACASGEGEKEEEEQGGVDSRVLPRRGGGHQNVRSCCGLAAEGLSLTGSHPTVSDGRGGSVSGTTNPVNPAARLIFYVSAFLLQMFSGFAVLHRQSRSRNDNNDS